jgi:Uma2 family endonuclease
VSAIAPTAPLSKRSFPAYVITEGGDQRTVFRGVDRHTYDQLSQATGHRQPFHLVYDGKDLEIVVIGNPHERYKEFLGAIIRALIAGMDLESMACGQTTWKTAFRGLEADLSYYFDPEKIRMAEAAFARLSRDPADYPPPDLAIEVDLCPPQVDRPAIYGELGVVEVWRLVEGPELTIEQLQADGTYAPVEVSRFLRIRPEVVLQWLNEAATEREAAWNRRLNQWAMGLGDQG